MRIATANNYYYLRGGSERVLLDEERCLRTRGHTVIPFSSRRPENEPAETEKFFVPARRIDSYGWRKIPDIASVIHNFAAGQSFGRLLDTFHPDLVHAHNIYGTLTTAILVAARSHGIPTVMTAHDTKMICASYLCLDHGHVCEACAGANFYHCALRRCHNRGLAASCVYTAEAYFNSWLKRYDSLHSLITPSRFLKALLEKYGVQTQIEVIPNGVDTRTIAPRFSTGKYALYAGRLSAEKGILTLIQASKASQVPLRIVGDGPIRREAEKMAGGCANIRFEGYLRGAELNALFRDSAFLVTPSEWYENAPMSVLEAFAYGKSVLGANIGGIPELVRPGETGELFSSGDIEELAICMQRMWSSRNELVDLGRNARGVVEKEYSLDLHCDRVERLYEHILQKDRSGRSHGRSHHRYLSVPNAVPDVQHLEKPVRS
ncbi:MAG: glycosyltransferase family 4 protein [Terracidiphilus sp.]